MTGNQTYFDNKLFFLREPHMLATKIVALSENLRFQLPRFHS